MSEVRTLIIDADGTLRVPRGTTLPVSGMLAGDLFFKTDTNVLYQYSGSAWVKTISDASSVGLSNVTNDAQLKRSAGDFGSITNKGTPVIGDVLLIEDSENAGIKKSILIGALPSQPDSTAIHKATAAEISAIAEKTAPVDADVVLIEDSASTPTQYGKRRVQVSNLAGFGCKVFSPSEVVYSAGAGGAVALTIDGTTRVYLHGTRSSTTPTLTVYVYGKIPCDFKSFSTSPVAIGVTQRRVGTITTSITLYKNGVVDSTINGVSLAPGTSFAEATFQPGSTFVPGDEYLIIMTAVLGNGLEYDWANLRITHNRKVG